MSCSMCCEISIACRLLRAADSCGALSRGLRKVREPSPRSPRRRRACSKTGSAVWAALRPSGVESRFEALHASGLTEIVGREEELDLLLRRWSRAKTGEGRVVLMSGEAGIGKSRLTAALLERIATEPHTRLRYFCSPQHTVSPLYPIISQMERAAGLADHDTRQAKLDRLDALLAQTSTSVHDVSLLADMLSLRSDGRYPAIDLIPEQRRKRTLEALVSQVETLTQHSPVLMFLEDAHWADPTSLEAFGRIIDRVRSIRVSPLRYRRARSPSHRLQAMTVPRRPLDRSEFLWS